MATANKGTAKARKILIADDEPNIVTALEFLLGRHGHEVFIARDGGEALAIIAACTPDMVLLDVMMPVRSGYEVCRQLRAHPDWRHIKIIMLSAKGRDAEVRNGMAMGADLYVTKPFSTRDLMAKITALLEGDAGPV